MVDSTSTISADNHIQEQVDTREDTLSYLASIRSRVKEQLSSSDDETDTMDSIEQNVRAIWIQASSSLGRSRRGRHLSDSNRKRGYVSEPKVEVLCRTRNESGVRRFVAVFQRSSHL